MRVSIFLLFTLWSTASSAQSLPGASVSGRVWNIQTGGSIPNAKVVLTPALASSDAGNQSLSTASLSDGSFEFDEVREGPYIVTAKAAKCTEPSDHATPEVVIVHAGQRVTDVALRLSPEATLRGAVLDQDGKPVRELQILLLSKSQTVGKAQLRRAAQATTSETGEYTIGGLVPGTYILLAQPSASVAAESDARTPSNLIAEQGRATRSDTGLPERGETTVPTYYPSAMNIEDAADIEVRPGDDIRNTNLRVRRALTHSIKGTIDDFASLTKTESPTLTLLPESDDDVDTSVAGRTISMTDHGAFEMSDVPPGTYILQLTGIPTAPTAAHSQAHLWVRQEVGVAGQDVTGLVLRPIPPTSVTGSVKCENATSVSVYGARVALLPTGQMATYALPKETRVDRDGTFHFNDLDPVQYRVQVSAPAGLYLQSVTYGGQDVMKAPLDPARAGRGELRVVLHSGAAEIDGTLQPTAAANSTPSRVIVLLIPDSYASDGLGANVAVISAGGFSMQNIQPGHYLAFALARYDSKFWKTPGFLREIASQGVNVDATENATTQIELPLTTEDQVKQAASRAGITGL